MSDITSIHLPTPIDWNSKKQEAEEHINLCLNAVFIENPYNMTSYIAALVEVCSEDSIAIRQDIAEYWKPFLINDATLQQFFFEWLTFTPAPANPGKYIEYWDYLVNTEAGLVLANDEYFKPWFSAFLNYHGDWINSTDSTSTLNEWISYQGTEAHPFNINDYQEPNASDPTGGYVSFNQFFLRNLKPSERPLCSTTPSSNTIVAPCDGGVFYLDKGASHSERYTLPGKSGDKFNLVEAIPGYGKQFVGGPLLDILLWFTDYHHFHAPVDGTVIYQGMYEGSYNYDFSDYNPKTHFAPALPADSDRVGWYNKLGKHQRYLWVINTKEFGLVAMIAIGFWGVGSIVNAVDTRAQLKKGDYMGHFGYGGSSIVLAFEPDRDLVFSVGDKPVSDPDNPVLMKVRQCLGKSVKQFTWD